MQPNVQNAVFDSKRSCSIVCRKAVEGVTRDDFPLTLPSSNRIPDVAGQRLLLADTLNVAG